MKKILMVCAMALLFVVSAAAYRPSKVVFSMDKKIESKEDAAKIKQLFKNEYGVENIDVYKGGKRITIEYDADKTSPDQMKNILKDTGYMVVNSRVTTIKAGALY